MIAGGTEIPNHPGMKLFKREVADPVVKPFERPKEIIPAQDIWTDKIHWTPGEIGGGTFEPNKEFGKPDELLTLLESVTREVVSPAEFDRPHSITISCEQPVGRAGVVEINPGENYSEITFHTAQGQERKVKVVFRSEKPETNLITYIARPIVQADSPAKFQITSAFPGEPPVPINDPYWSNHAFVADKDTPDYITRRIQLLSQEHNKDSTPESRKSTIRIEVTDLKSAAEEIQKLQLPEIHQVLETGKNRVEEITGEIMTTGAYFVGDYIPRSWGTAKDRISHDSSGGKYARGYLRGVQVDVNGVRGDLSFKKDFYSSEKDVEEYVTSIILRNSVRGEENDLVVKYPFVPHEVVEYDEIERGMFTSKKVHKKDDARTYSQNAEHKDVTRYMVSYTGEKPLEAETVCYIFARPLATTAYANRGSNISLYLAVDPKTSQKIDEEFAKDEGFFKKLFSKLYPDLKVEESDTDIYVDYNLKAVVRKPMKTIFFDLTQDPDVLKNYTKEK